MGVRFAGFDDSRECRGSYYRSIKPSFRAAASGGSASVNSTTADTSTTAGTVTQYKAVNRDGTTVWRAAPAIDVDYSGLRHRRHGDSDKLDAEHLNGIDFDVFGSETTGGFQVSGSNEWFANIVQVGSVFAFVNSSAIKRTRLFLLRQRSAWLTRHHLRKRHILPHSPYSSFLTPGFCNVNRGRSRSA